MSYAQDIKAYLINEDNDGDNIISDLKNKSVDNATYKKIITTNNDNRIDLPPNIVYEAQLYIKDYNINKKEVKKKIEVMSQQEFNDRLEKVLNKTKSTIVIRGNNIDAVNNFEK